SWSEVLVNLNIYKEEFVRNFLVKSRIFPYHPNQWPLLLVEVNYKINFYYYTFYFILNNPFQNSTALEYGLNMQKIKSRTLPLTYYGIELAPLWYKFFPSIFFL